MIHFSLRVYTTHKYYKYLEDVLEFEYCNIYPFPSEEGNMQSLDTLHEGPPQPFSLRHLEPYYYQSFKTSLAYYRLSSRPPYYIPILHSFHASLANGQGLCCSVLTNIRTLDFHVAIQTFSCHPYHIKISDYFSSPSLSESLLRTPCLLLSLRRPELSVQLEHPMQSCDQSQQENRGCHVGTLHTLHSSQLLQFVQS